MEGAWWQQLPIAVVILQDRSSPGSLDGEESPCRSHLQRSARVPSTSPAGAVVKVAAQ